VILTIKIMKKTKIIFWGTPEFAEIILKKIIQDKNLEVLAVVTAPDKSVGRKHILTSSLVKIFAEKNNISILQPEKLDEDFIKELNNLLTTPTRSNLPLATLNLKRREDSNSVDLFVVAAYGKIIPLEILEIPKYKSINIHPSLLPKYRGASPIQSTILNAETKTGTTIILMDEKMDHGKIIKSEKLIIKSDDTYTDLHNKLADLSAKILLKIIPDFVNGKIQLVKQEHSKATFCKIIKKSDGEINWENTAEQIYNQWRAFFKWPKIYSQLKINNKKQTIKFLEIKLTNLKTNKLAGEFFVENKKLYISCKNKTTLEIIQLQPEGKKIMNAQSFINGYLKIANNTNFS